MSECRRDPGDLGATGPWVPSIPARRWDLVDGTYDVELPAEHADRPAAVRITDMLGEEVLVVEERA